MYIMRKINYESRNAKLEVTCQHPLLVSSFIHDACTEHRGWFRLMRRPLCLSALGQWTSRHSVDLGPTPRVCLCISHYSVPLAICNHFSSSSMFAFARSYTTASSTMIRQIAKGWDLDEPSPSLAQFPIWAGRAICSE